MTDEKPNITFSSDMFINCAPNITAIDDGSTPSQIDFCTNNQEGPVLSLLANGDILVRGKKVTNDIEVVDGMRAFLLSKRHITIEQHEALVREARAQAVEEAAEMIQKAMTTIESVGLRISLYEKAASIRRGEEMKE